MYQIVSSTFESLAKKNGLSRSALLAQTFMFGLRDPAELYQLMARITVGSRKQEGIHQRTQIPKGVHPEHNRKKV
jgi:hypothetical protein